MKNSTKILLIVASCLILLGCGLAAGAAVFTPGGFPALVQKIGNSSFSVGLTVSGLGDWDNAYSPDNHYEVDVSLSRLDIDWSAGRVTLTPYEGAQVIFEEEAGEAFDADHALRYGVKNGTLYIQYCRKGLVSNLPAKQLTVYIPSEDFFRSIRIDSASAEVCAQDINCELFEVDTASGNVELENIRAADAQLSTTSGDLRAHGSFTEVDAESTSGDILLTLSKAAEHVSLSTTSGDAILKGDVQTLDEESTSGALNLEGTAQHARFSTVSGNISAAGSIGYFEAESTSGQVSLCVSAQAPNELEISTVSGDVWLALPENADFTLDFDTVSGDFDSELSVSLKNHRYICGSGSADYEVETSSGSLRIQSN